MEVSSRDTTFLLDDPKHEDADPGTRLPDFLIVGAARSGTTTLYYHLRQHPRVFMPDLKEPFFFTFVGEDLPYAHLRSGNRPWKLSEYSNLFADAREGQLLGEASTSYLYLHAPTIRNIERIYGDRAKELRVMGVLRDPVERTFSNYLLLLAKGWDDLSFDEYLDTEFTRGRLGIRWDYDYIGLGSYAAGVEAYLAAFPRTRFFLYEDLTAPEQLLAEAWALLGVRPPADAQITIRSNPAGVPRSSAAVRLLDLSSSAASPLARRLPDGWRVRMAGYREDVRRWLLRRPTLNREHRTRLIEVFRPDVIRLQTLLGRDLSAWLDPG